MRHLVSVGSDVYYGLSLKFKTGIVNCMAGNFYACAWDHCFDVFATHCRRLNSSETVLPGSL